MHLWYNGVRPENVSSTMAMTASPAESRTRLSTMASTEAVPRMGAEAAGYYLPF